MSAHDFPALTATQRAVLQGAVLDLGEFEAFLRAIRSPRPLSDGNIRSVLKVIEPLSTGEGVTSRYRSGRFFGRGNGPGTAGTAVQLDQDLVTLKAAANIWLPKSGPHKLDKSNGWGIDHPLKKLILFQRHKFEALTAPFEQACTPMSPQALTPVKALGKRRREEEGASTEEEDATSAEELEQVRNELALARGETIALRKLSLAQVRSERSKIRAALHRCEAQEEELLKRQIECIACYDAPKQVHFAPCGHVAMCTACAAQVSRCPMCRSAIRSRMKAIIS
mmetsp:Transcript_46110/g.120799  ORF Transcript_46110/g.120799 Transcript_46110/m.120799 type:complete len:281 (-) Transcript_46110:193-1035(-)